VENHELGFSRSFKNYMIFFRNNGRLRDFWTLPVEGLRNACKIIRVALKRRKLMVEGVSRNL
jgi:predicted transglutaminase-like cysteine proteinase